MPQSHTLARTLRQGHSPMHCHSQLCHSQLPKACPLPRPARSAQPQPQAQLRQLLSRRLRPPLCARDRRWKRHRPSARGRPGWCHAALGSQLARRAPARWLPSRPASSSPPAPPLPRPQPHPPPLPRPLLSPPPHPPPLPRLLLSPPPGRSPL
eukprot:3214178-Prymnesium_polylepis.3